MLSDVIDMVFEDTYKQLLDRVGENIRNNVSYDCDDLINEVQEDIELYGEKHGCFVWCDPDDNFVKDYVMVWFTREEVKEMDRDEINAIKDDEESFAEGKSKDDLFIIHLCDLASLLRAQNEVVRNH